jgi:hypothetical protein
MPYLDDWKKLKSAYEEERKKSQKDLSDANKILKKEKKKDKLDLKLIEELMYTLDQEVSTRKKKVGMSKPLEIYDKLLPKLEKLVEQKIPADNAKLWDKALGAAAVADAALKKANKSFAKKMLQVKTYESSLSKYNKSKVDKVLGASEYKRLVGKSSLAKEMHSGLINIQRDIEKRIRAVDDYYSEAKGKLT